MIKLSERSIMLELPDGSKENFELNKLQSRIIESFIAAGESELWAAEDLALAIEHAMSEKSPAHGVFTLSELNELTAGMLSATGFTEASGLFRQQRQTPKVSFSPDKELLCKLIAKNLHISEDNCAALCEEVIKASRMLSVDSAEAELFLALAKYYRDKSEPQKTLPDSGNLKVLASVSGITQGCSAQTRNLVEQKVLCGGAVSSLFPAVKLNIKFCNFARLNKWQVPITEMQLFPQLPMLAAAIDDYFERASELCGRQKQLGLYLKLNDCGNFLRQYFQTDDSKKLSSEIASELASSIKNNILKLTVEK